MKSFSFKMASILHTHSSPKQKDSPTEGTHPHSHLREPTITKNRKRIEIEIEWRMSPRSKINSNQIKRREQSWNEWRDG